MKRSLARLLFSVASLVPSSSLAPLILLSTSLAAFAQANGKLQIHFMSVGNGDGAVLISPLGEVVFFDAAFNNCDRPAGYLRNIGITRIDYLIVSHYHLDHIGCAARF